MRMKGETGRDREGIRGSESDTHTHTSTAGREKVKEGKERERGRGGGETTPHESPQLHLNADCSGEPCIWAPLS